MDYRNIFYLSQRIKEADPRTYLLNRPIFYVVRLVELINDTSLMIGDYEFLKEAAIDPFAGLRDAYAQYRQKMVEAARGKPTPPKPGGVGEATK